MSKLRLGIIGTGGRGVGSFGQAFTTTFADRVDIVGLADTNTIRAGNAAKFLGISPEIHDNAGDLASRSDVEAIVVTSPDCFHEEHALLALQNNKHVFIDKPLATTVDGCLNVIEASRRAGTVLYMGFNLRHQVVVRRLRDMAREGLFGDLFQLQAIEHYNGGRTYHSRWNRLKEFTGGLFIHKGSHDFDVLNYIMGDVRPARVSCFGSVSTLKPEGLPFEPDPGIEPGPNCTVCPYNTRCRDAYAVNASPGSISDCLFNEETAQIDGYYKNLCMYMSEKDTHDQGVAIIEYDNGATATHTECFVTPISNRQYFLEGTKGHGEGDLHANQITFEPRWSKEKIDYQLDPGTGSHGGADPVMQQNFLDCIAAGDRPTANAIDGTWSVAVAVAAELSRAERRMVEISELMDPGSDLLK
ncbi:MAG: Gfo/Idh/MocA family oxidoreductase [Lentisphaerae bacterium]|jgi:predicted dehydrogenase|nr:Gfo/Idh/MocA family oxidoreductase [Lentisphaerota bacterium]MBT5608754.1 Gfo/Idh/MocA family oxidoreductase [Lentisphaerota bacterium]MBT7054085.1 Gfo/Idh/MocA family oxidoreductase [Lentisphaerota bacterium]MBT7845124.1 Gfo/Idh/MocA family oxidoreductase [Lentisphaerota bacterium]